jgi:uncharacterized protein (TIGR02757 family)
MLGPARVQQLRPLLEGFLREHDDRARMGFDPIEFPHRYQDPADIEVVALISACLAYGRADLFRPILHRLFQQMGQSPADFAAHFDPARHGEPFRALVYRFNLGSDLAQLVSTIGVSLRELGSLGAGFDPALPLQEALQGFVDLLRSRDSREVVAALGPLRGFDHLLPQPQRGGSCKRLLLFLRWMVRGPDEVDFGLWEHIPASALVIPLDTHISRISRNLGLTRRADMSWKTADDITLSLRQLDPLDPVKFDFALCHLGISGRCPVKVHRSTCEVCPLQSACSTGRRVLGARAVNAPRSADSAVG